MQTPANTGQMAAIGKEAIYSCQIQQTILSGMFDEILKKQRGRVYHGVSVLSQEPRADRFGSRLIFLVKGFDVVGIDNDMRNTFGSESPLTLAVAGETECRYKEFS